MPTGFVTGANSGIGHAFAQLLINEGYNVIAADITIGDAIKSLGCKAIQLDVSSPDSIENVRKEIGDQSIDLLLNIAGTMTPDDLETVSLPILQKTFSINTYGPLLLTQSLLPNLTSSPNSIIAVVTSRVGSIADNTSGRNYAYRASKTAVNSLFKCMSVDLKEKGVPVMILHPGMVKSAMTAQLEEVPGLVEPQVAANGLWKTVKEKGTLENTGKFWHRDGWEIPW